MLKRIFTLLICVHFQSQILANEISSDKGDPLVSMIRGESYDAEMYDVTTKDGYILSLYRIPPKKPTSKVVFAMHGMFTSAADFLVLGNGNNKALAYALSDAGYDIWLGNARGTKFSRKHTSLNANDDEFWHFSWNEIGMYDVPAFIDAILSKTGEKSLHYIGHSQGTTTFFVMLSQLPEYNEKIRSFHGLSPVMNMQNPGTFIKWLSENAEEIELALTTFSIYEFPTAMPESENVASMFCKEDSPFVTLCGNLIFAFMGKSAEQFNGTMLGPILRNTPAGLSFRQIFHFMQMVNSGKFQMYNFKERNLEVYKSPTPPEYRTENIRVKMQIFYGTHDTMATPQDVEILIHHFGNQVIDVVKLDDWNHVDFLYGKQANEVYRKIIEVMAKH